jgi:broad-specificity NMP kinase
MEVIAAEARESYDSSVVMEVVNDTPEQMETAIESIAAWVQQCRSMEA